MATERIAVKSSTVFVSVDHETRVFRSVDEVPPEWRKRFERPRGGLKPQTILIADRRGREEIMRSLQGQPSAVQTRWNSAGGSPDLISGAGKAQVASIVPSAAAPSLSGERRMRAIAGVGASPVEWQPRRIALEAALALAAGIAVAYAFYA